MSTLTLSIDSGENPDKLRAKLKFVTSEFRKMNGALHIAICTVDDPTIDAADYMACQQIKNELDWWINLCNGRVRGLRFKRFTFDLDRSHILFADAVRGLESEALQDAILKNLRNSF